MKYIKLLFILSLCLFVIGACSKKSEDTAESMKQEAGQAYESAKEGAAETKEAFVSKVNNRLAEMETEMDKIESKINETGGVAKEELEKQWESLKDKKQKLEEKIASLQSEGEENWEKAKTEIQSQWASLQQSFNNLKDKIEGA